MQLNHMSKIKLLYFLLYPLIIQIISVYFLFFLVILIEENIRYEKFAKVYFLFFEFNYDILTLMPIFAILLSFVFQIIFILNHKNILQK
jgi:hypothetical protein